MASGQAVFLMVCISVSMAKYGCVHGDGHIYVYIRVCKDYVSKHIHVYLGTEIYERYMHICASLCEGCMYVCILCIPMFGDSCKCACKRSHGTPNALYLIWL